jgi:hypothetical protein
MRRAVTALAVALASLAGGSAVPAAQGGGATQIVQAKVSAAFGFAVDGDGRASPSATTIPAAVTRERVGGVEIITITPLW